MIAEAHGHCRWRQWDMAMIHGWPRDMARRIQQRLTHLPSSDLHRQWPRDMATRNGARLIAFEHVSVFEYVCMYSKVASIVMLHQYRYDAVFGL